MRILTVRQPWAWAIIHGGKDVENRVRNIAGGYRGPVAIHVAQANAAFAPSEVTPPSERHMAGVMAAHRGSVDEGEVWPWYLDRGAIIGVVDLVDVHRHHPTGGGCMDSNSQAGMKASLCSPWADQGVHHLVLANPRALDEPIPYRGALGLRKSEFAVANDYLVAPWGHPKGQSCTPMGCEPWCEFEPVGRLVATS